MTSNDYNLCSPFYRVLVWLSRDPIEEQGFITSVTATAPLLTEYLMEQADSETLLDIATYNFVGNNPINYYDKFGLHFDQNSTDCLCGPDVTDQVDAIRSKVKSFFNPLNRKKKFVACSAILWGAEWDIVQLRGMHPKHDENICEQSVAYKGHCYHGGSVNYILWGMMRRECTDGSAFGFGDASLLALSYKSIYHYLSNTPEPLRTIIEDQTLAFTMVGFYPSKTAERVCLKQCAIKKSGHPIHKKASFEWHWYPYKAPSQ